MSENITNPPPVDGTSEKEVIEEHKESERTLRRSILLIHNDSTLTAAEKARKIQVNISTIPT